MSRLGSPRRIRDQQALDRKRLEQFDSRRARLRIQWLRPSRIWAIFFCDRALCHEIDHLDGKMYVDIEDHEIVEEEDEEEQE